MYTIGGEVGMVTTKQLVKSRKARKLVFSDSQGSMTLSDMRKLQRKVNALEKALAEVKALVNLERG